MSADRCVMCPACTARELDKSINHITAEDLDYGEDGEFEERYEFYIDHGNVFVEYSGDCRDCGYSVEFKHEHPLPGVDHA